MKKFLITSIVFVLILLVPLACADLLLKDRSREIWFHGLATRMAGNPRPYDFIFVGNSTIAAAIDADEFAQLIKKNDPLKAGAVNMGQGYSTPVEYIYGFKKVLEKNPHALEGVDIFIGAPGGIPAFDGWSDDWMNPAFPNLLSNYIDADGLRKYFETVNVPLSEKAMLLGAYFSTLVSYWPQIQASLPITMDRFIDAIFPSENSSTLDLSSDGGIANNTAQVKLVRERAKQEAERSMSGQIPIDWDKTVMRDLVSFLQAHGARVFFINIPQSPVMMRPMQTETRKADIKSFRKISKKWNTMLISSNFYLQDEDFPDLLHLRKSFQKEYTSFIANVFLVKTKSSGARSTEHRSPQKQ